MKTLDAYAAFLTARWDEIEAAAQALVLPEWDGYRPHPELSRWIHRPGEEVEYEQTPEMLAHPYPDPIRVTNDSEGLSSSVEDDAGDHIAIHDPRYVLDDIAAKRRILAMQEQWPVLAETQAEVERVESDSIDSVTFRVAKKIQWFTTQEYRTRFGKPPPTTPVVLALAEPFRDHPDHPEASA